MTYRKLNYEKPDQIRLALSSFPQEIQELFHRILYPRTIQDSQWAALQLAVTIQRRKRKHERDAERDARARTLVGARLPRETARRVRQAAQGEGVSVYRWIERAIEKGLEGPGGAPKGGALD